MIKQSKYAHAMGSTDASNTDPNVVADKIRELTKKLMEEHPTCLVVIISHSVQGLNDGSYLISLIYSLIEV